MKINNDIKYEFNPNVIKNPVNTINSISEPTSKLKEFSKSNKD